MDKLITYATCGLHEHEAHKFSLDASDLGLRPGEWPRVVDTTIGNRQPFLAQARETRDGDLLWVDYRQNLGCVTLRVYND